MKKILVEMGVSSPSVVNHLGRDFFVKDGNNIFPLYDQSLLHEKFS
jgi:hypothetical protein